MKILYDHLCFGEKYGGVSKLFVEMPLNFPGDVQYSYSVKNTKNEYFKRLNYRGVNKTFRNINFRGKTRLLNLENRMYSIWKLIEGDFDIYHQTHYDPYAYKYLSKKKRKVTTIHDMNFFVIPEAYINYPFNEIMEWQKISALRADKIATPSNNSKKDMMRIWSIPEGKIDVAYPGNDIINLDDFDPERIIKAPYVLFVGYRQEYKNFNNYLKAFKLLSEKNQDLLFICTGIPLEEHEINIISGLNLSDKVLHISADENTMVNLYRNAEVFVYPSLYEGFGLPLIEAMACRCPVVCSNTSCFPEVAENAARYFDPYSIENMFEVTHEVLENSNIRNTLINNGTERIKQFSWKKCADRYISIYKSLL
jgi:glycosyltransferase involved in cell wall biosynthesis